MKLITTQKELDKASSEWVKVEKGSFVARGSAHVEARDFSSIVKKSESTKIKLGLDATLIYPKYPNSIVVSYGQPRWNRFLYRRN